MNFDSPVQEIKDRLNILEVIQDYVQLKKAGTNYKGICPFHSEKTPSFVVTPSKQMWYCFGCNLGGDVFEFMKLIENLEFAEALKILADRAGVELKKPTPQQIELGEKKNILYEINKAAADYFAKVLWESPQAKEALEYLKKRGLTEQTIKNWHLGWAPDDFHYLENFLAKSFKKEEISLAGLIVKKDNGSYFDRFRGRIMFPILNLHGQTVGFTGRLLQEKENTGKYINSPETPIYNKSQIIYGLYQAKNAIRKENRAVLVEGNMDVISCHQAGTNMAVASSGTAFTEDQFRILARFTENLIFAFDADKAGLAAARRALEIALNLGLNVKIVDLAGAKDPDDLIKKGIGLWQKKLNSATNFVEYFFDKTFAQIDHSTVEGKREIVKELAPLIYRISEPVTRAHFIRKLSSSINVAETAIWDIINKIAASMKLGRASPIKDGRDTPKSSRPKESLIRRKDRVELLQEQLLGLSLINNTNQYLAEFKVTDFKPDYQAIFDLLSKNKYLGLETLKKQNPKLAQRLEYLRFSSQTEVSEQGLDDKEQLKTVGIELKKLILKEKMEQIAAQLAEAEKQKNKQMIEQLSKEFTNISSKLHKF